ncbi:HNH endonuclease signature motif containing protein [Brevibacterium daeguense]|uniref:HNH endonuclease signature motif containing protein n=1 Tax=Brevibacterium daeguense TaxID=909936 RepID=A0ABP8EKE9_9MICO|nr:HNH endonuclease signature motif containing protein [Brevibacterium daeguense]
MRHTDVGTGSEPIGSAEPDFVEPADRDELVRAAREAAARVAQCQAEFLAVLDRIERTGAWEGWIGIRSLPHWVAQVCEMNLHTAREYLRVMRGLRRLPQVAALFAAGRVSYSKVREITRLAGRIDQEEAARMCQYAQASQLSRMVSVYRRIAPVEGEESPRELPDDVFRVHPLEGGGRARITIELPEAEAAELLVLVDAAVDEQIRSEQRPDTDPATLPASAAPGGGAGSEEHVSRVDRLLHLLRLGSRNPSATGAARRRAEVYVHISTDAVAAAETPGAARAAASEASTAPEADGGTTTTSRSEATPERDPALPAGPSKPAGPARRRVDGVARIEGYGPITGATAARLMCESPLVGALIDASADVLALGRSRRLASPKQRRALAIRDVGCQFPGCSRTRRLEAHHIRPWSRGGPTDLDAMLLLCRSHHIAVHEHHLLITRATTPFTGALQATSGFDFATEDGTRLVPPEDPDKEMRVFDTATIRKRDAADSDHMFSPAAQEVTTSPPAPADILGTVPAATLPSPDRISTIGGGEGFDLGECVRWIFDAARFLGQRTGPEDDDGSRGRAA